MSLQETSEKFKELFLLAFTRELIINSSGEEILELESEEFQEEKEKKKIIKEVVKQASTPTSKKQFKPLPKPFQVQSLPKRLVIPMQRFPPRLQYIQPTPGPIQVDLGKLNKMLQDPIVQTIECHGPNKEIVVRAPSARKTNIKLTKEEINKIVENFAEKAKIPSAQGIFRVAVGKLIFSAIISDIVGTKFIIKKIPAPRTPQIPRNLVPNRSFNPLPRR